MHDEAAIPLSRKRGDVLLKCQIVMDGGNSDFSIMWVSIYQPIFLLKLRAVSHHIRDMPGGAYSSLSGPCHSDIGGT